MALDPRKMTNKAIEKAIRDLQAELERRSSQAQSKFLSELRSQADSLGIPVDDVIKALRGGRGAAPTKRGGKRGKVKPKYRNPADKSVTWSGRGRKPRWVVAHLDAGGAIDDLAI